MEVGTLGERQAKKSAKAQGYTLAEKVKDWQVNALAT